MAGHSKWKNIKHKKALTDKLKMKKFTKLSLEITNAAKDNNDPAKNPLLRNLLEKANSINMPKENCLRAIKKTGESSLHTNCQSFLYEGYAPHNVAILVDILSENKNKVAAHIRSLFNKNGGRICSQGGVLWMFKKVFIIEGEANTPIDENFFFSSLLEYNIFDIEIFDKNFIIFCHQEEALVIKNKIIFDLGYTVKEDFIGYLAKEKMQLNNSQEYEEVANFVSILEESDDVQNVFVAI